MLQCRQMCTSHNLHDLTGAVVFLPSRAPWMPVAADNVHEQLQYTTYEDTSMSVKEGCDAKASECIAKPMRRPSKREVRHMGGGLSACPAIDLRQMRAMVLTDQKGACSENIPGLYGRDIPGLCIQCNGETPEPAILPEARHLHSSIVGAHGACIEPGRHLQTQG